MSEFRTIGGSACAEIGGEILGPEHRGANSLAGRCNGAHVDHSQGGLADRKQFGPAGCDAQSVFMVPYRRVQFGDLLPGLGHGQADDSCACIHGGHEVFGPFRVEGIDPDCDAPMIQVDARQQIVQQGAGDGTQVRRREVLEVEDEGIGAAAEHFTVHVLVGARAEQPGAWEVLA